MDVEYHNNLVDGAVGEGIMELHNLPPIIGGRDLEVRRRAAVRDMRKSHFSHVKWQKTVRGKLLGPLPSSLLKTNGRLWSLGDHWSPKATMRCVATWRKSQVQRMNGCRGACGGRASGNSARRPFAPIRVTWPRLPARRRQGIMIPTGIAEPTRYHGAPVGARRRASQRGLAVIRTTWLPSRVASSTPRRAGDWARARQDICAVPIALKSSANPRNDQVRADRGNENGNKQPVHFEAPPKLKHSTDAGARALPKFVFCNRGKLRLRPVPAFVSSNSESMIQASHHHAAQLSGLGERHL